jgi:hypothetical protein
VGADLMRGLASAGAGVVKNGYARVNYFKIKPGAQGDWVKLGDNRMETAGGGPPRRFVPRLSAPSHPEQISEVVDLVIQHT